MLLLPVECLVAVVVCVCVRGLGCSCFSFGGDCVVCCRCVCNVFSLYVCLLCCFCLFGFVCCQLWFARVVRLCFVALGEIVWLAAVAV